MRRVLTVGLCLLALAAPTSAEVSVTCSGKPLVLSQGGIWTPVRKGVDPGLLLNPWGDATGDGLPSVTTSPKTGFAEIAWADNEGDFDISFARWAGDRWYVSPATVLTGNDVRPVLSHDGYGNRYLIWQNFTAGSLEWQYTVSPAGPPSFSSPVSLGGVWPLLSATLAVDDGGTIQFAWIEHQEDQLVLVLASAVPSRDVSGILRSGEDTPIPFPLSSLLLDETVFPSTQPASSPPSTGFARNRLFAFQRPNEPEPTPEISISDLQIHLDESSTRIDWVQDDGDNLALMFVEYAGGTFGELQSIPLEDRHPRTIEAARREARKTRLGK